MDNLEVPSRLVDDTITIAGRSDIDFWCRTFSISPFTLFYVMKTVGNSARHIGDFLHKDQGVKLDSVGNPIKSISIL
jgi:hypothetical protein